MYTNCQELSWESSAIQVNKKRKKNQRRDVQRTSTGTSKGKKNEDVRHLPAIRYKNSIKSCEEISLHRIHMKFPRFSEKGLCIAWIDCTIKEEEEEEEKQLEKKPKIGLRC